MCIPWPTAAPLQDDFSRFRWHHAGQLPDGFPISLHLGCCRIVHATSRVAKQRWRIEITWLNQSTLVNLRGRNPLHLPSFTTPALWTAVAAFQEVAEFGIWPLHYRSEERRVGK